MEMTDILKKHFAEVEAKVGPIDEKVGEAIQRLSELEQKMARRGGAGDYGLAGGGYGKSAGEQFVENERVQGFLGEISAGRRIGVELKAVITSTPGPGLGAGGGLVVPATDTIAAPAHRRMTVRDLLPVIPVSSGSVEFPRVKTFINAAAMVAEGALKPQSDFEFELVTEPVRTVAHWTLASRQILDDVPQLQGFIDSEMKYGLAYAEELQLLHGDGTGQNLHGIYPQAVAFAAGSLVIPTPNTIDVIGASILQNALAEQPATGVVLHPADWAGMRLLKNSQGEYILGDPGADVEPRLFGVPVVATQAMIAGKFLTGNFETGATIYDRMVARVEISTEDADNFRKNLVTILAEERLAIGVKLPTAFVKGDFTSALADLGA